MTKKNDNIYYPYTPRLQWKVKILLLSLTLAVLYLLGCSYCNTRDNKKNDLVYTSGMLTVDKQTVMPNPPFGKHGGKKKDSKPVLELIINKKNSNERINETLRRFKIFTIDKSSNTLFYKVYPGNTVSQLSRAFGISQAELREIAGGHKLYAYQKIKIPISKIKPFNIYRVKKGDTLMGLAKKFNAYRDSISVINHIWKPSGLKAGRHILVLLNRSKPDQNKF